MVGSFITTIKLTAITGVILLLALPFGLYAGGSSVSNSVSVSASGDGTSKASVKTTINGDVVEDTTITKSDGEPIQYTSSFSESAGTQSDASTSITLSTNAESDEALRELLQELLSLLTQYVSLLESQQ